MATSHDKALKTKKKSSFVKRLETHKAEGRSLDSGHWKSSKGESFEDALYRHKIESVNNFR